MRPHNASMALQSNGLCAEGIGSSLVIYKVDRLQNIIMTFQYILCYCELVATLRRVSAVDATGKF